MLRRDVVYGFFLAADHVTLYICVDYGSLEPIWSGLLFYAINIHPFRYQFFSAYLKFCISDLKSALFKVHDNEDKLLFK